MHKEVGRENIPMTAIQKFLAIIIKLPLVFILQSILRNTKYLKLFLIKVFQN